MDLNSLHNLLKNSDAVLFDMDGVVTDTMPVHCKTWISSFKRYYNIVVPEIEIYNREGEKSEKSVVEILHKFNINASTKEIEAFLNFKVKLFSSHGIMKLFKGINTHLKRLKKSKRVGLVTGTQRKEIVERLPIATRNLFEVIITSDDVKNGKPHPEPYQKAMIHLNIPPQNTLVVENAPYGIKSAISAGAKVVALPTSLPVCKLKEATLILNNHKELYAAINDL